VGEGVPTGANMRLEQEAAAFSKGKRTQFSRGLNDVIQDVQQYLADNLHNTDERHEALKNLVEVQMWSERSVSLHGVKQ
jgi:hypothetical protein